MARPEGQGASAGALSLRVIVQLYLAMHVRMSYRENGPLVYRTRKRGSVAPSMVSNVIDFLGGGQRGGAGRDRSVTVVSWRSRAVDELSGALHGYNVHARPRT